MMGTKFRDNGFKIVLGGKIVTFMVKNIFIVQSKVNYCLYGLFMFGLAVFSYFYSLF